MNLYWQSGPKNPFAGFHQDDEEAVGDNNDDELAFLRR